MMHYYKKLVFVCVTVVMFSSFSYADNQADVTLNPKNPAAFSPVTLTVSSYSFDVNTAMITWKIDSKVILSGQGEKKLTIKTGAVGSKNIVTVLTESASGVSVEQTIQITPENISILYESPESYVPPFYDGRSLPSDEARTHFVAMPQMSDNGQMIAPKNIAYTWYVNDQILKDDSGIAKQELVLPLEILSESTVVKVVARTPLGTVAENTVTVFPHAILPILYPFDEIFGVHHERSYTKRIQADKDFTIALEPYFFSLNGDLEESASFRWALDGIGTSPLGGRILALKPKENTYGSRKLTISLSNSRRRLQKTDFSATLVFDTR